MDLYLLKVKKKVESIQREFAERFEMADMKEEAEEARKETVITEANVNNFDTQREMDFDQRVENAVRKAN